MSKRVRTSRVANSKKSRRPRPSGEREVSGRESLSSVDFDDARTSSPDGTSDAPPSSVESAPSDTDRPDASLTPSAVVVDEAIVPALVTGETPPPAPVSADDLVPGDATPPPAAALPEVAAEAPVAAKAEASAPVDAPVGLKKKKKKGAIGGTRPEDVNASSGALSLNEPLARGFYESAPPPDVDDEDEGAAQPVALSPAMVERQAKLRRIVMGVFAAASLVVLVVAGKTLLSKNAPPPPAVSHATETAMAPKEEPKPAEPPKPEPAKAEPAKAEPAPAPAPSGSADAAKPEEKKEEGKAEEKKEEPKPTGDPAELKKTATKLYNSGKLKDAIPALRDAIAADPDDAMSYLFLGDALTNTGKWPEAKEAYNECVRHAKKGPKYECAAMGGHK